MCCTQKEMAWEGKTPGTEQWYSVKVVPCCVPSDPERGKPVTEQMRRERQEGGMDTGVLCGRCENNTIRLLRVVEVAEQHEQEELPIPLAECACPCGNKTVYTAPVLEEMARAKGVELHVSVSGQS